MPVCSTTVLLLIPLSPFRRVESIWLDSLYFGCQGACGTCPSSAGTMKMGIERSLKVRTSPMGPLSPTPRTAMGVENSLQCGLVLVSTQCPACSLAC